VTSAEIQSKQSVAVVVTREKGKNGKLQNALKRHSIPTIELPLIEHATGPDRS
jgi:uroporphyrinogen-III synthase